MKKFLVGCCWVFAAVCAVIGLAIFVVAAACAIDGKCHIEYTKETSREVVK